MSAPVQSLAEVTLNTLAEAYNSLLQIRDYLKG